MQDVVIVAATRTAIGSFQGALANVPAVELGATVIRALLEKPASTRPRSMKSSSAMYSPPAPGRTPHARPRSRPACPTRYRP